jgi:hypothetical protein
LIIFSLVGNDRALMQKYKGDPNNEPGRENNEERSMRRQDAR